MLTIAKIHLSTMRAMIGLVLLALLVMGFVVFVFWLQFFASDEVSKAVGIGIARWALTLVVFALLWATGTVLKDPVRLLITGERARGVVVGVARVAGAAQQDSLESPVVEFVTSSGERVRVASRMSAAAKSAQSGTEVMLAYDRSNPEDAQLLMWREFIPGAVMLGFLTFVVLLWMSAVMLTGDRRLDDALHILPAIVARLRLNPVRFPLFFVLACVIPTCVLGTYVTSRRAIDLHVAGLRTTGWVVGLQWTSTRTNDRTLARGDFAMIAYRDKSGEEHIIRRTLAKPVSRLVTGDEVEVLYPARHPARGVVNTWDEFYLMPMFFGLLTIAFLVLLRGLLSGSIPLQGS